MWASEYVAAATALISDPAKAAEVTRELLTHLEEIKVEAIAAGVEADMAEAMALTRMGLGFNGYGDVLQVSGIYVC